MAQTDLNWTDDSRTGVTATWSTINGLKARRFDTRQEAEAFAEKRMGRTGSVLSTLDMTAEQLDAWNARKARAMAALDAITKESK